MVAVTDKALLNGLEGGAALLALFGGEVPHFHDAEVQSLVLDRMDATGTLTIRTMEISAALAARTFRDPVFRGAVTPDIQVLVVFSLRGISALELSDFHTQNVIGWLDITRGANGTLRLAMAPCVGLSGWLEAREIRISLPEHAGL